MIVFGILIALILALTWWTISDAEDDHAWTVCYEMVNQNVTWEGAGYNGYNAHQ